MPDDEVDACAHNISALKGKNDRFPNCRENQVNGDSTGTKKLKLQNKVAAKVPFSRVQFVSLTV